jgi:hypothetical protein
MVKFSIPRKSDDKSVLSVYISLDSNAYKDIFNRNIYTGLDTNALAKANPQINPEGVRATYIVFFEDGSYKDRISFDQTLYRLSTFYNEEMDESLYKPKKRWGRYRVGQNEIAFEVGLCEYTPGCRFRLKSGYFDIINDSTLKVNPVKNDNARLFGKQVKTFHKIDSIDLSFIDPSKAWHNRRDLKKQ